MSKSIRRTLFCILAALTAIVVGLGIVAFSAVANRHEAARPSTPNQHANGTAPWTVAG